MKLTTENIAKTLGIPEFKLKILLGWENLEYEKCRAETITEAKFIFKTAQENSEEKEAALFKWEELALRLIEYAKNAKESLNVFDQCHPHGNARKITLENAVNLSTNIEELKTIIPYIGMGKLESEAILLLEGAIIKKTIKILSKTL